MNTVQQIFNKLNELATIIPWVGVLEFLAASGVLSVVLVPAYRFIKRYFDHHKAVMHSFVALSGLLIGVYQYLMTSTDPKLAVYQGLATAFASQAFYRVGKAIFALLAKEAVKTTTFNQEVKTATLPVTGLPSVGNDVTAGKDFTH